MVTLADCVQYLFPYSRPLVDWVVTSVSGEESITYWSDALGSKPTNGELESVIPEVRVAKLKQRLATIRYEKESAGIVVGDQPVTTFRDEMSVWQGMLLDMTLRPGATSVLEYKPRHGTNVTLSPQQVGRIYECFAWYVGACFATERYIASQIGLLPQEQIEAMAGNESTWPQRQFDWVPPS